MIVVDGWYLPVLTNIEHRKHWVHVAQRFAKYEGLRSMATIFDCSNVSDEIVDA